MNNKKNLTGFWRDVTYCASPNCKNECGRMPSVDIKYYILQNPCHRVIFSYFCEEPPVSVFDIYKEGDSDE